MHSTLRLTRLSQDSVVPILLVGVGVVALLLTLANPLGTLVVGSWIAVAVMVRATGAHTVSPAVVVGVGLTFVAVTGRIFYPLVVDAPHATGIWLPADPDLLDPAFMALTMAGLGVAVGALSVSALARQGPAYQKTRAVYISENLRALLVVCGPLPVLWLVFNAGLDTALERNQYLPPGEAAGFASLVAMGATLYLVAFGYLLRTQRGVGRAFVAATVVLSVVYLMSTGSRRVAAVPILLAVGYLLARADRRARWLVALGSVATLYLLPLPLYWRTLKTHGLVPYWESLGGYLESGIGVASAAKTVLVSLPIIGATAEQNIPAGALATALDPRSGQAAGWYDIASQMRLNPFTPMAGVGELLSYGLGSVAVFFLAVGVYLGFLDRHVRYLASRGHHLVVFAHVGFAALFLAYMVQYNLRSGMRMLYYSLALWVLYTGWANLRKQPRRCTYPVRTHASLERLISMRL